MSPDLHARAVALLKREFDPNEYARIRDLWVRHSLAEDGRDLDGLLATLTPDCVYELVPTGDRWHGHDGARRFYEGLLGAFPDVRFALRNIVIGPQGVWEEAHVTGTFARDWLGFRATGMPVAFDVQILFPWRPEAGLFEGERVWVSGLPEAS
jgi:hypothetical protein